MRNYNATRDSVKDHEEGLRKACFESRTAYISSHLSVEMWVQILQHSRVCKVSSSSGGFAIPDAIVLEKGSPYKDAVDTRLELLGTEHLTSYLTGKPCYFLLV